MKYTTFGSVRGACGHLHKSIAAAVKCRYADMRGCKRSCGVTAYTDRYVYGFDVYGRRRTLDDDEFAEAVEAQHELEHKS